MAGTLLGMIGDTPDGEVVEITLNDERRRITRAEAEAIAQDMLTQREARLVALGRRAADGVLAEIAWAFDMLRTGETTRRELEAAVQTARANGGSRRQIKAAVTEALEKVLADTERG